ncbi:MAG: tetratricopeptide repeat protein [Bacteroidales bacterium]|nr:tetratricopeptide repeat protein [Bacteroidales bacterium]
MYKKLVFVPLIVIMVLHGLSQEVVNTQSVDQETYTLYLNKQWKELIEAGNLAKKNNIDFYYLQYRMGIAYYELKNYRKAIPLFEKVIKQTPEDNTALEYLYYSYLLSGRKEDARILTLKFNSEMRDKLNVYNNELIVNGIGFEYKKYLFDDYTIFNEVADDLEQRVRKDLNYLNLSLTHYSQKKFKLFHAFSYLFGNNHVFDPEYDVYEFDETVKQFQYYIAGNWHLNKGSDLKIGLHYLNTKLEALNPDSPAGSGQGGTNNVYLYYRKLNSFVGFAKYSKSISNFNFKIASSISNLNDNLQLLPLVGIDYYPFGNTNFYLGTEIAYQIEPDAENYDPGFIFKQKIGISLFKTIWIEPFLQYGEVSNFVDEDAFVIYNNPDVINYWYGVNLNLDLYKSGLTLYFIYQQYSNTNFYKLNDSESGIDYNSSTFLGGLKWNF